MAVDACGLPIHFSVTGGGGMTAPELVARLPLANTRLLTKAMTALNSS
jgi:hypothetical protein